MEAKFSPFDISKVKFLALHVISCMVFLSSLGLICYVLIPETNFLGFACDLHFIIDASCIKISEIYLPYFLFSCMGLNVLIKMFVPYCPRYTELLFMLLP